jgi:hypothetical protein
MRKESCVFLERRTLSFGIHCDLMGFIGIHVYLICCIGGAIVGREEYEASCSCCLYRESKESLQRPLHHATAAHVFNPLWLFCFWVEIVCSLDHFVFILCTLHCPWTCWIKRSFPTFSKHWIVLICVFFLNGDFWIGGLFEILGTAWDPMKVREVGLRSSGMYRMAETGLSWSRHVFYPWNSRFHWQTLVINGDKTYGYFMVYQQNVCESPEFRCCYILYY